VSDIAKKAAVNRSTAYVLLDMLAKRGLVSISERGGIRVYSPAPAERFVQMAESSLNKWNSLRALGQELLVEFKKESHSAGSKPAAQLFSGVEGIKTAYAAFLTPRETVRSYSNLSAIEEALPGFLSEYRRRQAASRVRARIVAPDTPQNRKVIAADARGRCEYFLAPSRDYTSDFIISGNKVAFISFDDPSVLLVENAAFAALQKALFDALMNEAQRWNVKPEDKKTLPQRRQAVLAKASKRFFSV
jgi:sugar-specific transcriptional regulator TrmB